MSSPHRFVVRRQAYTPPDAAGVRRLLPEKHERVATFPKPEAAFADCATRLAEFRRTTNPFQLGGPCLFYQTNLPPFALHDYLLDHGLTPPPTSLTVNPNYVFWWVKNSRTFTDREREAVWSACDKLTPFEVIEEDDRKSVHVVVEAVWCTTIVEWGDEDLHTSIEGGHPVKAFALLRNARQLWKAITEAKRQTYQDFPFAFVRGAEKKSEKIYWGLSEVPFTEVVPVPLDGGIGASVSLLVRQSYRSPSGGYDRQHGMTRYADGGRVTSINLGSRVPIAAASDRGTAGGLFEQVIGAARRKINPFALLCPELFRPEVLLDQAHSYEATLPNGLTIDDAVEIVRKLPTVPPAPEVLSAEWYDRVVQWSPEFIDVIWATFADFRLFEVIEVPLG